MSDVAVAWAKAQDCPTRPSKPLLAFLATYANAIGEGWAAIDVLSVELQCDHRSIQRGLAALRAAGLLEDTGKWELYKGKRYPVFRLPLETGFANTAQRMRAAREAAGKSGVTVVSPQNPGRDDSSVIPRGDSSVTQIGKGTGKGRSHDLPGPVGAPVEEAFEEAFAAYERRGQDRTHRPDARRLFAPILAEVGRAAAVAMVRRYVAEDPDLKRGDYGAAAFETWLESERWRRWLPPPGAPPEARTPFVWPDELAPALAGVDGLATYLVKASWCAAERTLYVATVIARDRLLERIGRRRLTELNINIARAPAA